MVPEAGNMSIPMKEFKDNGVKVYMATEDGSVGAKGRVSVLFDKIDTAAGHAFIYTCGPNPMLKAVQAFAAKHGLLGQVCLRRDHGLRLGGVSRLFD